MPIVDRDRIQFVVACGSWQAFRIWLKGQDTQSKLDHLALYMSADDACQYLTTGGYEGYTLEEGWLVSLGIQSLALPHPNRFTCGWTDRRDQVLNYLTALSRGGLIEPLTREVWESATEVNGDVRFDLITIRR
jgi:hypothetical protein